MHPDSDFPEHAATPGLQAFLGKPGTPVPEVNAADLQLMWRYTRDLKARHPEGDVAAGVEIWRKLCSPGANISALTYRLGMVGLLEMTLGPTWRGGQLSDAALKVAARMPLEWLRVGVIRRDLPFDVVGFLAQVKAEQR